VTGGSHPFHVGKGGLATYINPRFKIEYLPEVRDPRIQLALALYREALSVNSVTYKILGFFKVLNIKNAHGADQIKWIDEALPSIKEFYAIKRIEVLRSKAESIGQYLYASCRCAVAHAFSEPVVDPENPDDTKRLAEDLPLIKALAEHLIESEFGIKSYSTFRAEHLYQLEGFRELLGAKLVEDIKSGRRLPISEVPIFPPITLRVSGTQEMKTFENMSSTVVEVTDGTVILQCVTSNGYVELLIGLDVGKEYLVFDPFKSIGYRDDASDDCILSQIDVIALMRGLILNGVLEVWDAVRNRQLGRTDPYVGVNIDLSKTIEGYDEMTRTLRDKLSNKQNLA
jgi:hypothetical protein